jgi:hypothetical protein
MVRRFFAEGRWIRTFGTVEDAGVLVGLGVPIAPTFPSREIGKRRHEAVFIDRVVRDRWFESGSLQRGDECEPDFGGKSVERGEIGGIGVIRPRFQQQYGSLRVCRQSAVFCPDQGIRSGPLFRGHCMSSGRASCACAGLITQWLVPM